MKRGKGFDAEAIGDVELIFQKLAGGRLDFRELKKGSRRQNVLHVVAGDGNRA